MNTKKRESERERGWEGGGRHAQAHRRHLLDSAY